jgi:integrase
MPYEHLTLEKVESIKPPPKGQIDYWDDPKKSKWAVRGLVLRVSYGGTKTWGIVYWFNNRVRRMRLGDNSNLKLDEARRLASEALSRRDAGHDPAAEKAAAKNAKTFAELAVEYVERHAKPHKKSWRSDERTLNSEVLPRWRHLKPADISRSDVRALIERVADRGAPIQANRVLALVRKLFNFAIGRDWLVNNPCHLVAMPGKEIPRDRVLNDDEICKICAALEQEVPPTRAAFRLQLLTAQRGGEVKQMRWADLDLDGGWWTIPASRAKNGLSHRVPLNAQAVKILTDLQAWYEQRIARQNRRVP